MSRFASDGFWKWSGGYDRVVVVVVVTVFVSTHSSNSICRLDVSEFSTSRQSTDTSRLLDRGRGASVLVEAEFEVAFDRKGLGDASVANPGSFEELFVCIETARRFAGSRVGGSMMCREM
jgi:hypothetical protein